MSFITSQKEAKPAGWTLLGRFGGELLLMPKIATFSHKLEVVMNMNVSLTKELANFVKGKVSTGRYSSSSEVVREALRLMEKVETQEAEKLRLLRKAWQEGVDSGDAGELDFAVLKQEARKRLVATKA